MDGESDAKSAADWSLDIYTGLMASSPLKPIQQGKSQVVLDTTIVSISP